ncbi:FliH/SctL family protein [Thermodesulfobacterium hydrogeniphilum]|uniref:FliH/SctL family protein n=1 Tax=Thermodesulfobacterium hydrogeniphilum TaxID=161156 RepID=UPI000571DB16|nr:FliH/SctL family protein [Thermodesulfobacterium hydrogeniphilum]
MSKILKNKEILNFSVLVPDLNPVKEEKFKFAFEKTQKESINLEKELEKLKEKAIKEGLEKGYKEGLKKGYLEGYEKGYKDASEKAQKEKEREYRVLKDSLEQKYNKKIKDVEKFLKNLKKETENSVLNLDKEVLKLAIDIAEKIVCKEIKINPEISLNIIKEALNYIAEGIEVNIKVNPEELNYLKENLLKNIKTFKKINFIPDESISKGGVFIETSLGVIDATFEKRWQRLLDELLKDEN